MKNSKERILEALSDLLPEDARGEVSGAIDSLLDEATKAIEESYNEKLRKAYDTFNEEKEEAKRIAESGYGQAFELMSELRHRIEVMKEEFDRTLDEEYKVALDMIVEVKKEKENLEMEMYEEYDARLGEIKEFMVNKLDTFLKSKGNEFYEEIKHDVLNDPCTAEHKVALENFLDVAVNYLNEDHYINATSRKFEEVAKQAEQLKDEKRILEAKNMRLSTENHKLNEAVRKQNDLITESINLEQKERVKKAKKVEGKGKIELDKPVVIGEFNNEAVTKSDEQRSTRFVESTGDINDQWEHLAGINE